MLFSGSCDDLCSIGCVADECGMGCANSGCYYNCIGNCGYAADCVSINCST